MKKYILAVLILIIALSEGFAQTNFQNDTTVTFKSFYARINPIGTSIDAGKYATRMVQNIEIGRTYGPLDIGLSYGRFANSDSTNFAQIRTTFDATQIGVFSSEFALGAGKVFNSSTPLLLEISTTLMAQINQDFGIGAIVGTYDLIGENNQFNKTFYGLFLRYGLLRNENGGLVGRFGKHFGRHLSKKKIKIHRA
jgi:hypothetical protein